MAIFLEKIAFFLNTYFWENPNFSGDLLKKSHLPIKKGFFVGPIFERNLFSLNIRVFFSWDSIWRKKKSSLKTRGYFKDLFLRIILFFWKNITIGYFFLGTYLPTIDSYFCVLILRATRFFN